MFDLNFFLTAILLGLGLAMDAFSVSLANGLNEPCIKNGKTTLIAVVFAFFQALMPLIGWFLVRSLVGYFNVLNAFIPYVALILLSFIGGKMLYEGIKSKPDEVVCKKGVNFVGIIVQGIATSIDALSTGFTITNYNFIMALVTVLIIAVITFVLCFFGVKMGKKFGTAFSNKASIFGGAILIFIGLQIFIKGVFA